MSHATHNEIAAAKRILGTNPGPELYTKQIECPIHPAHEARDHHDPDDLHEATLYCYPHPYAGIWECPVTEESDSHEHEDYQIEDVEVDDSHPDRTDGYTYQVYVCGTCGVTIDRDEADPATDAAEAQADMEADDWRDE